ncbi:MAG: hypothetical protein ACYTFT_12090, partial [Planctomycetota bacterium]
MNASLRQVARAVCLVLLTLALPGCGYLAGAAAIIVSSTNSGGGGGGGTIDVGSDVSAEISNLPRPISATPQIQEVRVRLTSQTGRAIPLRLSFKAAGATDFQDAKLFRVRLANGDLLAEGPFTETGALPTSADGVDYILEWAWQDDLGTTAQAGVSLGLSLIDDAGQPLAAFLTEDRKVGNDAPVISNVAIAGTSGSVVVTFRASDSTADDVSIDPFFRIGGGALQVMTGVNPLSLQGLGAAAIETELSFVWDTTQEAALIDRAATVIVELIPRDENRNGVSVASGEAQIVNNVAAEVIAVAGQRSATGSVSISFTLKDTEGDAVSVEAVFRLAGSLTSAPATVTESLIARETSSDGFEHTVTWTYLDDFQQSNASQRVQFGVQIAGTDAPVFSNVFGVGNDAPATEITSVFGDPVGGAVPITFTLLDALGDRASATVRFSANSGPFTTATPVLAGGLTNLLTEDPLSPGQPFAQTFVWDSAANLPNQGPVEVVIEIAANDQLPDGAGTADPV